MKWCTNARHAASSGHGVPEIVPGRIKRERRERQRAREAEIERGRRERIQREKRKRGKRELLHESNKYIL